MLKESEKKIIPAYVKASRPIIRSFVRNTVRYYWRQIDAILSKNHLVSDTKIPENKEEEIQQNCLSAIEKTASLFFIRTSRTLMKNQLVSDDAALIAGTSLAFDILLIRKRFEEIFLTSCNYVNLIGKNQTSRILCEINIIKYMRAGLTSYIWRTAEDERVVGNPDGLYPFGNPSHEDHFVRDGKTFRFDMPPGDGPPGWAINCRCVMLPLVDE
jgi:hypothetical protein